MPSGWVFGHGYMPDLGTFKTGTVASLLRCRYFSLVHPRHLKQDVCGAIENFARSFGRAWEFRQNGEVRKIAVSIVGGVYTLEFAQAPIGDFLAASPELKRHGDFVTTIKVPRSNHGSMLACTAGLYGIIDEHMLAALTTNEAWPGGRIKFDRVDWRGRTFNATRFSYWNDSIEYLNIPRSICAQVINAYQERLFVGAAEAQRRLMMLRTLSGLVSREMQFTRGE